MNDMFRQTSSGSNEEKRALLASLLRKKIQGTQFAITPVQPRPEYIPLSFSQQRMWFLDQLIPGSTYNIPVAARLRGKLNLTALQASLREVERRHEVIRTSFLLVDGKPYQHIAPVPAVPLVIETIQASASESLENEVIRRFTIETQRPFDLSRGPLLRGLLLHLGDEDYALLMVIHHSIADGWSISLLLREFSLLYNAYIANQPSSLPELPVQYVDYTLWQRKRLKGPFLDKQLTYWRQQLANIPPALALPTDYPRPPIQVFRGAPYDFTIPDFLARSLKSFSQRSGVTLFMTLLAAFQILLARYSGQDDIVIGSPIANRTRPEVEHIIGCFINTLALHVSLRGDPSFNELLKRVRDVTLEAYTHQDMPFELLVEELRPERDLSRNPLFQVMFALQNIPRSTLQFDHVKVERLAIDTKTTGFDLTLFITETEQKLEGNLNYSTDLFTPATAQRMVAHYLTLLSAIIEHPEWSISDLPILTRAEHVQMEQWNATERPSPGELRLSELFEAQVKRTPQQLAVVCNGQQWTYQGLNRKANQLARYLQRQGVVPGTRVGLYVKRSPMAILGILAILKAGGVYIPLDTAYPDERITFILDDAQVPFLLTQENRAPIGGNSVRQVIDLSRDWEQVAREEDSNVSCARNASDIAYIIYTSGSTGRPKGTAVYQHGLLNLLNWFIRQFSINGDDKVLLMTSLSFDLTQKNIFAPLLVGGQLSILDSEYYDARIISQTLFQSTITILNCTPSAFYPLVFEIPQEELRNLRSLRYLFLGGEPISALKLQAWVTSPHFQAEIVNTYGPTECTDIASFYHIQTAEILRGAVIPLGKPIDNVQLFVLDKRLRRLPVGIPGELFIAGSGVGAGYINDPVLTATRFIPDPFAKVPGKRLYRTGDLARYLPDGNLEFLGRGDTQIKLRGFRIELAEIETLLASCSVVKECVVLLQKDDSGEQRLVAYIVPAQNTHPLPESIRDYLKEHLPDYMLPAFFIFLDSFPLSPHGKIDRNALPSPKNISALSSSQEKITARTDLERLLSSLWSELLGLDQIDIHDNFFELGGHSLLAVSLFARLAKHIHRDVSVKLLFLHPTIASLAQALEMQSGEAADSRTEVMPRWP